MNLDEAKAAYSKAQSELIERLPWLLVCHRETYPCRCGKCVKPWDCVIELRFRGSLGGFRRAVGKQERIKGIGTALLSAQESHNLYYSHGYVFGYECYVPQQTLCARIERLGYHRVQILASGTPLFEGAWNTANLRQFGTAMN